MNQGIFPFQTAPFLGLSQLQPQTQQPQNIQYVSGKQAVDQLYLPPNASDVYLDSNGKNFYTKHTDANGNATIEVFEYKKAEEPKPVEYVTKAEFEKFKSSMKGAKHEPSATANHKGE